MKKNTIRLNESQLRQIVKESVKRVLNEEDDDNLPFEYGNPDGVKSGSCSGEEMGRYYKSIGQHFNQVYPHRNGVELYTINTENGKNPVYFATKKEAKKWISKFIQDKETAQNLLNALKDLNVKKDIHWGDLY